MSFKLIVKPEAVAEAAAVFAYYARISPRLADRFAKELDACYRFIERDPSALPKRKRDYRHMMVRRFRYRVVYKIVGNDVVVYQVRHTSRRTSRTFGP